MRKQAASLLIWLTVCVAVLALFVPSFYIKGDVGLGNPDSPVASLSKNWLVHYGPKPPGEGENQWQTFDETEWRKLESYKGTLWVKRTLPAIPWRNPYLFVGGMNRFEVELDGRSVYSFNMDNQPVFNQFLMTRHPIRIDPEDEGKTLALRIEWDRLPFFANAWILAGNPDQMLASFLRNDAVKYVYAIIYMIATLAGIILYLRRKEMLFFWFSTLAFTSGFGLLLLCTSLQWFVDVHEWYYWRDLLLPIGVWAFTGLYAEALGSVKRLPVRITKNTLLIYAFACLVAGIISPTLYWKMLTAGFPWLALAAIGVVIFAMLKYPAGSQPPVEKKWLRRGFIIQVVCGLGHIISNSFSSMDKWLKDAPYLLTVIGHLLANGLFLFMVCNAMILIYRVRKVYRESEQNAKELQSKNAELEQFHRNLEQLVATRTVELEQANQTLSDTLRDKAETMAEMSVLEERNRIAHEMHDVVGHTLTAAIVQLEASKKLAAKEGAMPHGKLDMVSGLVRKGLDDIRRTVRMLKSDAPQENFETTLRELIRETVETMEVAIEAYIDIPRDLGRLTEQVVYHALQEGLTNGIRHGRCSWFKYSLQSSDDGEKLEIRLWNDGAPYGQANPGFGLSTMAERIRLLGGTFTVGSSEDENGSPFGCELAITLPLRGQPAGLSDCRLSRDTDHGSTDDVRPLPRT
ncbi:sensor histidine kinase [Cohnella soli]|uniref:histidine kinase n=1 Tax=Cohnella soli TaxID=425005 RepID=A0ABW0HVG8_9BACL